MTAFQKVIKYLAMAFAVFLSVSIIGGAIGALGLFAGFFGGDAVDGDVRTYEVYSDICRLEADINAADFTIRQGEKFLVESNLKHLTVEEENGVLSIRETKKFGSVYNGALLTLYIPADTVFEKISIKTGAGRLTAGSLSSEALDLELGAGDAAIESLVVTAEASIDGGAGRITVSGGALHNLDLDMGIGQFNLTSALTGDCSFDLGVGESNITVIGDRENCKLAIDKGIGSITVDGERVSDLKEQGSAENRIDISGGIGAVNLKFKNSPAN